MPMTMTFNPPPQLCDYPSAATTRAPAIGQAPRVSIVTVVYNGASYLEEAIRSVIAQRDCEYIIIDGGSTDGTVELIERYQQHVDHWVSEPDGGIYDAMNKGIAAARGQLIKLLNADDVLEPGAVAAAIAAADRAEAPVVVKSPLEVIDASGAVLKRLSPGQGSPLASILHPSWFVDRRLYERFGLYRTDLRIAADYEMYLRLRQAEVRFIDLPMPLARFRSGGASAGFDGVWETYEIHRRYFGRATAMRHFLRHAAAKLRSRALIGLLGEQRMYELRRRGRSMMGHQE